MPDPASVYFLHFLLLLLAPSSPLPTLSPPATPAPPAPPPAAPPRGQRRSPSRNTARASRELRGRRQRRGRPVRVLPPPCGGVGVLPPPGRARRVGRPGSLLGTARMTRWLKPPLPSVEELSLVVTLIHAGLLGPGRGGASPADTDGPQSAGLRPYRLSSAAR